MRQGGFGEGVNSYWWEGAGGGDRVCGRAVCEGPSSPRSEGLSLALIQIVFLFVVWLRSATCQFAGNSLHIWQLLLPCN